MTTFSSLSQFQAALAALPGADAKSAAAAAEREPNLTKPAGSLGRLEELSGWLATWQGRYPPTMEDCRVLVFAGNHGVTAQGVSVFPAEVTVQMVANFSAGGAAINQLSGVAGAKLDVIALDLETPTADFSQEPALDDAGLLAALNAGADAVGGGCDAMSIGEMGIGNTTSAAAICHALFGGTAEDWVGPGTGVEGSALDTKIKVVGDSVAKHGIDPKDGLAVLQTFGGRELAAMAGAMVAARQTRTPVILDGYVCGAAAAALNAVDPALLDHCVAGHVSAEPGHQRLLDQLGKVALINLNMRLGEASGAAVALNILKCAVACHTGMATFAEAGVSDKD
ncbi:MAG: nicotinate-nucleotide--dimethylbenzimidazole phosphoribosyltransferase [Rhodospirillaceae bacterium]